MTDHGDQIIGKVEPVLALRRQAKANDVFNRLRTTVEDGVQPTLVDADAALGRFIQQRVDRRGGVL